MLISILNMIGRLIFGNSFSWLLNLNHLDNAVGWARKLLVNFSAGKSRCVSFACSNNSYAIDVETDGSDVDEKSSSKMLGLSFFCPLEWATYKIVIAKTTSENIRILIGIFFPLRFCIISINIPSDLEWNILVMSDLVPLIVVLIVWISSRNAYLGLLVLQLLLLLFFWFTFKDHS